MPPLSSAIPGPYSLLPSRRNGSVARMPLGYTVSMCAISMARSVPSPISVPLTRSIPPVVAGTRPVRAPSARKRRST